MYPKLIPINFVVDAWSKISLHAELSDLKHQNSEHTFQTAPPQQPMNVYQLQQKESKKETLYSLCRHILGILGSLSSTLPDKDRINIVAKLEQFLQTFSIPNTVAGSMIKTLRMLSNEDFHKGHKRSSGPPKWASLLLSSIQVCQQPKSDTRNEGIRI